MIDKLFFRKYDFWNLQRIDKNLVSFFLKIYWIPGLNYKKSFVLLLKPKGKDRMVFSLRIFWWHFATHLAELFSK